MSSAPHYFTPCFHYISYTMTPICTTQRDPIRGTVLILSRWKRIVMVFFPPGLNRALRLSGRPWWALCRSGALADGLIVYIVSQLKVRKCGVTICISTIRNILFTRRTERRRSWLKLTLTPNPQTSVLTATLNTKLCGLSFSRIILKTLLFYMPSLQRGVL